MHSLIEDWRTRGYVLLDTDAGDASREMACLREKFIAHFKTRFSNDARRNRNLIKLFAEDISVKLWFAQPRITNALQILGLELPVHTGPIVTHYTANDLTSGSYGLPYHQDWPSMGTSKRGVNVWTTVQETDASTHGLTLVPGSHLNGLLPGKQTDTGYILDSSHFDGAIDLTARAGQILLMSPYLVHRTRIHPSCAEWKLSLSARFDDLACKFWDERNYVSAYKTTVDRSVYLT